MRTAPGGKLRKLAAIDWKDLNRLRTNRFAVLVSAFLLYLLITLIYFGPSNLSQWTTHIFSDGADTQQFVWMYNWWPYSITHHLNPFISYFNWGSDGYNLAWVTSIPGLSLLMAPVTLLGGALLSYNLVAVLSPALAATACFLLLRFITKKYLPSLLGGYIYGFSSFELGQMMGHAQMYTEFVVPVLVLLFLLAYKERIIQTAFVVIGALLLALQFTISEEIYATFIGFAAVALLAFYCVTPNFRERIRALVWPAALALLLSLAILSPFLYYMYTGRLDVPKVIHPMDVFSINAANYLIPTPMTLIGGGLLSGLSRHFTANISENGGYIGLPLVAVLGYVAVKYWRNRRIRALVIVLGILMVAALGPKLHIIGHVGSFIPMPWQLVSWLPFVKSAQPDRLTLYIFLVAAIIVAYWLSIRTSRENVRQKTWVVLAGALFLMPNPAYFGWQKIQVPRYFQQTAIRKNLPPHSRVLILPFERLGSSAYYQYVSGMYFSQTGAYTGFMPQQYADSPLTTNLLLGQAGPGFDRQLAAFCEQNNVSKIIYTQDTPAQQVAAIDALRWPSHRTDGVTVVQVPPRLASAPMKNASKHF